MAQNFQSSFIPKDPVTEQVFKKKKAGFLGVLAVAIFISSIVIAIGMYVYKGMIKKDIENLQSELAQAEKQIDKSTIEDLSNFAKKLEFAKLLVAKHRVVSNFMDTLASSTVSSVQFSEMTYGGLDTGGLTVTLRGKANNYASVALQENILSQNTSFKSIVFSNLALLERGTVGFDLALSVDPNISIYSP